MEDTRSNMQLAGLNYKPHVRKCLQNIIDCATGVRFYPPPGSFHYQQLCMGQFHKTNHINFDQNKKIDIKNTKLPSARNRTTKACTNDI